MPSRCNRGFYCRSYCLLNMFRGGITMPIIRSSRILYSGCCLWYFVLSVSIRRCSRPALPSINDAIWPQHLTASLNITIKKFNYLQVCYRSDFFSWSIISVFTAFLVVSLICDKIFTTQHLAFLSYCYRK